MGMVVVALLALTIHAGILTAGHVVAVWLGWGKGSESVRYRPFEITFHSVDEKKDDDQKNRQVVTIPPPEKEKIPKEARFASEFDSDVARETKARYTHVAPALSSQSTKEIQKQGPKGLGSKPAPSDVRKTIKDVERSITRKSALSMRTGTDSKEPGEDVEPSKEPGKIKSGDKAPRRKLTMADLRPSDQQLSKALGAPFPDALPDVPEGDRTLLKTKRWKFASFFNRVKQAVAQRWQPGIVYRQHDPTGKVHGYKSRLTVVKVWLYPDGRLKKIVLDHPCGLGFLDDEAVRAFRVAAPFPNPPKGLVDPKTNLISFRFGFILEIVRDRFRIFRY